MPKAGFTLIELSIVLVIIGLIVGGVLVGQDLIEASKIRKAISEVQGIQTAINTFRLKYGCIPGDCNYATSIFTDASTYNGNSNGQIDAPGGGIGATSETYQIWKHLGDAQLIPGVFLGTILAADTGVIPSGFWARVQRPGVNVPSTVFAGRTGYCIAQNTLTNSTALFLGHSIGPGTATMIRVCDEAFLSPRLALSIDGKIDDGKPTTGRVIGWQGSYRYNDIVTVPVAADCINAVSSSYDLLTGRSNGCVLVISPGF